MLKQITSVWLRTHFYLFIYEANEAEKNNTLMVKYEIEIWRTKMMERKKNEQAERTLESYLIDAE